MTTISRFLLAFFVLFLSVHQSYGQQKNEKNLTLFSDSVKISTGEYMLHIAASYQTTEIGTQNEELLQIQDHLNTLNLDLEKRSMSEPKRLKFKMKY